MVPKLFDMGTPSVNPSAILGTQILEQETVAQALDQEMSARQGLVVNLNLRGVVAAHRQRLVVQLPLADHHPIVTQQTQGCHIGFLSAGLSCFVTILPHNKTIQSEGIIFKKIVEEGESVKVWAQLTVSGVVREMGWGGNRPDLPAGPGEGG